MDLHVLSSLTLAFTLVTACSSGLESRQTTPHPTPPPASPAPSVPPAEEPSTPSALPDNPPVPAPEVEPEPVRYPFHTPLPAGRLPKSSAAEQHANLAPWQCRQELAKRKLPFSRDRRPTPGIATAVRFDGELSGVKFIAPGKRSPFGALDCRLALTLAAFAEVLAEHDVTTVRVDNLYRRGAKLPGKRKPSQHNYGLAIDILGFTLKDGRELNVEQHFAGERGAPVCGPESFVTRAEETAIVLRNLVCDVARRGLFHTMLTPNYDAAHENHLHLDIKRDAKSWSIR